MQFYEGANTFLQGVNRQIISTVGPISVMLYKYIHMSEEVCTIHPFKTNRNEMLINPMMLMDVNRFIQMLIDLLLAL